VIEFFHFFSCTQYRKFVFLGKVKNDFQNKNQKKKPINFITSFFIYAIFALLNSSSVLYSIFVGAEGHVSCTVFLISSSVPTLQVFFFIVTLVEYLFLIFYNAVGDRIMYLITFVLQFLFFFMLYSMFLTN